jgi:hypothetical protein
MFNIIKWLIYCYIQFRRLLHLAHSTCCMTAKAPKNRKQTGRPRNKNLRLSFQRFLRLEELRWRYSTHLHTEVGHFFSFRCPLVNTTQVNIRMLTAVRLRLTCTNNVCLKARPHYSCWPGLLQYTSNFSSSFDVYCYKPGEHEHEH